METNEKLNHILDGAIKIFARFGYKKASMEDIADCLGMTKGNLYFYCKNKRDLYEKAVARALLRWQRRVEQSLHGERDAVKRFVILATKSYECLAQDADLRAVISNDPEILSVTPLEDRFPTIGRAAYAMVREAIAKAVEQGRFRPVDVDNVAGFIYSAYCMFITRTYVKPEGHSADGMYRAGIDVMLKGLLI